MHFWNDQRSKNLCKLLDAREEASSWLNIIFFYFLHSCSFLSLSRVSCNKVFSVQRQHKLRGGHLEGQRAFEISWRSLRSPSNHQGPISPFSPSWSKGERKEKDKNGVKKVPFSNFADSISQYSLLRESVEKIMAIVRSDWQFLRLCTTLFDCKLSKSHVWSFKLGKRVVIDIRILVFPPSDRSLLRHFE